MVKVSVVVPIYNVEQYIERCLISLFEQTLDDIEYIFIDDCSPDKSIEILESVLKRYPERLVQTKIIRLNENKGVANAREIGVKSSSGEYIIHCDSDDWVDKNAYSILYNEARRLEADVVYHSYTLSNGFNNIDERHILEKRQWSPFIDYIMLWCKLVKRSIYFENDFIYTKAGMCEDRVYSFQIAYYAKKIVVVDKILYYYYVNTNSVCLNKSIKSCLARFEQVAYNQNILERFIESHGLSDKYSGYLFHLKYTAKQQLAPIINEEGIYSIWSTTYPEVNFFSVFKNEGLKIFFKYLLVRIRLFPFFVRLCN